VYASTSAGNLGGIWKSLNAGVSWQYTVTNTSADVAPTRDIVVAGNTIYIAGASSFVRSTDSGNTWAALPLPVNQGIGAMAVDPRNTTTIYLSIPGNGIAKSIDGGNTWQVLSGSPVITAGSPAATLHNALAVDPKTGAIYYGTDNGFYYSANGGESWSQGTGFGGLDVSFRDVAASPANPTILFALAGSASSTVTDLYTSTNGGVTWTPLAPGLDAERVVPDLQNVQTIYLSGLQFHEVYKSVNGGTTFVPSDTGTPTGSNSGGSGFLVLAGPTGTIFLLPTVPATLLAASSGAAVYRSVNAAQSWTFSSSGISAFQGAVVTFDPKSPSTIYFGALGGGIWRSTDNGITWSNLYQGSIHAIAVDPFNSSHIVGADYSKGLIESTDGGNTWSTVTSLPTPAGTAVIVGVTFDPVQAGIIYVSLRGGGLGVLKSTNNGQSYVAINSGLTTDQSWSPVAVNPTNPNMIFVGTTIGLFKSNDGGNTWALKTADVFSLLAIDKKTPTPVIYGSVGLGTGSSAKSIDLGETWQPVPYAKIIAVDPSTANSLFTIDSWSPDGGVTWQQILSGGLGQTYTGFASQFGGFTIAPSSPQILYMVSGQFSLLRFIVGP
jgi:photosystem II stability/assembly factor-like uncharacterized protein